MYFNIFDWRPVYKTRISKNTAVAHFETVFLILLINPSVYKPI